MCIAILNKKNVTLKRDLLETCWDNNRDGAGLAYPNEGKMTVFKELKSFDRFYDKYKSIRSTYKGNMLLHFRIATHGAVAEENCHPFLVNEQMAFIHNGIISNVGASKDKSDTICFNEKVLQLLPPNFVDNAGMRLLIEEFIGNSKLVFLDVEGNYTIYNESKGEWNNECWFSNQSYKPKPSYSGYSNKYVTPKVGMVYHFEKNKEYGASATIKVLGQAFVFNLTSLNWKTIGPMPQYDTTVPPFLINPETMIKALQAFEKGHLKKLRVDLSYDDLGFTSSKRYNNYFDQPNLIGQIVYTWDGLGLVVDKEHNATFSKFIVNMGVHQNILSMYERPTDNKYTDGKHRVLYAASMKTTSKWLEVDLESRVKKILDKTVEVKIVGKEETTVVAEPAQP